MVFSSLIFLFGFLPAFLTLYFLTPVRYRNVTALIGSYFFYAWGAPRFAFVLLASSVFDYSLSIGMERIPSRKRALLAVGLTFNIALLAYFKYANFFAAEFSRVLEAFGAESPHWTRIALPIGISFFTFQKISYLVDVYRGKTARAGTFIDYALYVALFPQLIAGPIVRYHDIARQLRHRVHTSEGFVEGAWRFCRGLGKKVLIANQVGLVADVMFRPGGGELTVGYAWIGVFAYAMQIYFDFSGYSDMAIGLGRMMGFKFLENFNMPYIARSFTDFWQRWHISLSRFMKEYLYIPLGGNRGSRWGMYMNLWIVFLISGIWHGADWTFLVWGIWHGFFLVLDKMFWLNVAGRISKYITVPLTFLFVLIGWVFFRAESISGALSYIGRMFSFHQINDIVPPVLWIEFMDNRTLVMLIAAMLLSFLPLFGSLHKIFDRFSEGGRSIGMMGAVFGASLALLVLSAMSLANSSFNPFIYYRF